MPIYDNQGVLAERCYMKKFKCFAFGLMILIGLFVNMDVAFAKDVILNCNYNILSNAFNGGNVGTTNCEIYSDYSHMCYINYKKTNENNEEEILNWSESDSSFTGFSTQNYVRDNGICPRYLYLRLGSGNDGYKVYGAKDSDMMIEFYDKFNMDAASSGERELWHWAEVKNGNYTDEEKKQFYDNINSFTKDITNSYTQFDFDKCISEGGAIAGMTTYYCEEDLTYLGTLVNSAEDQVNEMISDGKVKETDDAVKKFRTAVTNARDVITDGKQKISEYNAQKSGDYLEMCSYSIDDTGTNKISIFADGKGDYYINSSLDCYTSNMDFNEVKQGCFENIYYKTATENGKKVCYFTFDKDKGYPNSAKFIGSGFFGGKPLSCDDFTTDDGVNIISDLFNIIMIIGPILALVLGGVDFAKATLASDESALKKAGTKFGKRIIAAILLFLLPLIINLVLNIAFDAGVFGNMSDVPNICLINE
jgi:hypothetical protein